MVKKTELRNCKFCNHKKPDIKHLCYYCANRQSEHYLELIKDDTIMRHCKSGNAKGEKWQKYQKIQ